MSADVICPPSSLPPARRHLLLNQHCPNALQRGSEFALQRKKSKTRKSRFLAGETLEGESAKNSDALFSTVDRTILAELRQKVRAREEQFVVRGGRKYHACPPDEVPYPRSYDRQVVDM